MSRTTKESAAREPAAGPDSAFDPVQASDPLPLAESAPAGDPAPAAGRARSRQPKAPARARAKAPARSRPPAKPKAPAPALPAEVRLPDAARPVPAPPQGEGLTLGELLAVLWGGRRIVLGTLLASLAVALFLAWRATPIYQVSALLQVGPTRSSQDRPAMDAKVESPFESSSPAQAEAEILQSTQVLSRVVEQFHLDLVAGPVTHPLLGAAPFRDLADPPALEVDLLDLPGSALGAAFQVESSGKDAFAWRDPQGRLLAQGRVGELLQATWQGQPMSLKVRRLAGPSGQRFRLQRRPMLDAVAELHEGLAIEEKGRDTSLLGLSLLYPDAARGAEILNAILDQHTQQTLERQTSAGSQTLAFLDKELARVRDQLARSQAQLSQYQSRTGSADLGDQAKALLQQSVDMERQILDLRQKRDDLLRTFQPGADMVATLDSQIAKLKDEKQRLAGAGTSLPQNEQEVLALRRDVQVNQDQYANLMRLQEVTAQNLQMAQTGSMGLTRVVDRALPSLRPVKPRKGLMVGFGLALGLFAGAGWVLLRRALFPAGVEDPQELEAHFGLPVLGTIPHSPAQAALAKRNRGQGGILADELPKDLAVECLRRLRTSLNFAIVGAANRSILVTGASPGIGKSFVTANLAVVLAQFGARVLLVDGDMHDGKLHRQFGPFEREGGLSEILAGQVAWQDSVHPAHGLDLITTGTLPPDPSRLLQAGRIQAFLDEACAAYDYVVIDAPPVLAVADAAILGAHAGAVLVLVKDGQHPLAEIRTVLRSLHMAGAHARGFVFNDVSERNALMGRHRYTYHYTYQHS